MFEGLQREHRKAEVAVERWIEEGLQGVLNKRNTWAIQMQQHGRRDSWLTPPSTKRRLNCSSKSPFSRPKYDHNKAGLKLPSKTNKSSILVQPMNTEKASKAMTDRNTLTFLVHNRANKVTIKRNFRELFGILPKAVNTLNRPDGKKKAFVTLKPEDSAIDVASKLGII